ncbi:hypothetical protein BKI52_32840 [marine bacterium AO1-C]|nr:hypothetical protein BKI52_32840 [marine bacterium AO1-C]
MGKTKKITVITMPKIHDRGGDMKKEWYVDFRYWNPDTGRMQRFKKQAGLNSINDYATRLKAAKKLKSYWTKQLKDGYNPFNDPGKVYKDVPDDLGENHTIERHLINVLEGHKINLAERSFAQYKSHLFAFCQWLKETKDNKGVLLAQYDITDITTAHTQEFLNQLRRHGNTRKGYRQNISRLFTLLKKKKIVRENPWVDSELPKVDTTEAKRAFREDEREKFKKYCIENHLQEELMVIQFLYYTFIRPKELRLLKVDDIDFDNKKIFVSTRIGKSWRNRYMAIPEKFEKPLKEWVKDKKPRHYVFHRTNPDKPRGRDHFRIQHRLILDELGYERNGNVSLYSWKHTGVVALYKATMDVVAVQIQCGHADISDTMRYLHSLGLIENAPARKIPEL